MIRVRSSSQCRGDSVEAGSDLTLAARCRTGSVSAPAPAGCARAARRNGREPAPERGEGQGWSLVRGAFGQAKETLLWALSRPRARLVILGTVILDHLIRQAMVVSADVYSALGIGAVWLGPLGAGAALASVLFAKPLASLARRHSPVWMFSAASVGLALFSFAVSRSSDWWGVFPMLGLGLAGTAVGYLASLYLNQLAEPRRRATLLSVKGLVINLGYGWISLAYGAWVAGDRPRVLAAFDLYPPYLAVLAFGLVLLGSRSAGAAGGPGGYLSDSRPNADGSEPGVA